MQQRESAVYPPRLHLKMVPGSAGVGVDRQATRAGGLRLFVPPCSSWPACRKVCPASETLVYQRPRRFGVAFTRDPAVKSDDG